MRIRFAQCLLASITAFASLVAHADGTAHSLDKVPAQFDTPEARAAYHRDMGGSPDADGFGTHLPAGFTKQMLVAQLAPGQDTARVVLAGAKPWPQRANTFIAIVCIAPSVELAQQALHFTAPTTCDGYDSGAGANIDPVKNLVWLGMFERGTDGVPRLIARTEKPLDAATDWGSTNLDAPDALDANDANDQHGDRSLRPEQWLRFDFAPYLLRAGDYAFGVRAGWSVGYSGGGASFEALYLFRVDGTALRVVFAQPTMFYRDIAGDWHPNGTRDHDLSDGSNTLTVLPTSTNGFRDWQLRQRGGKWRQTFYWSAANGQYKAR